MTDAASISGLEIVRRELARRKLHEYIQYVDKRFVPTIPHAEYICKELDEVVRYIETGQGTPILVITVPPRHFKTTIVADHLPEFFLGRNPDKFVINTTYAAKLAHEASRRARGMLQQSEDYKNLFGERATFAVDIDEGGRITPAPEVEVSKMSSAVDRWQIAGQPGLYQALGFGSNVTGRGGHLIIIDDPHASREEAESRPMSDRAWTYVISTLWSRLEDNGAMVFIMQRWTEHDVVARLKNVTDPESDEYIPEFPPVKFVNLPALAEKNDPLGRKEGEALYPKKKDEKTLAGIRGAMGLYFFNSQYQQRATAPEGNLFKRFWFRTVPYMPFDYKIQYWDTAESADPKADYWACATLGVNKFGITLFDMYRKQMTPDEGQEEIFRRYDMHNREQEPVAVVFVEAKSSGRSMVSLINAGDRTLPIEMDKVPDASKEMRAGSITTVCKNRRVGIIQHAPWLTDFLDELCAFPNGKNDDQVDAFVGGVSKLVHGGFIRIGEQIRRARMEKPETGEDYRARKFGSDGRGLRPGGSGAMRKPPSTGSTTTPRLGPFPS